MPRLLLKRVALSRSSLRFLMTGLFSFVLKTPPASDLIKKALGLEKGAKLPGKEKVGRLGQGKVREIAQLKMPDLTAASLDAAVQTIMGTARSMGVEIVAE